jgi:hypothetical protein
VLAKHSKSFSLIDCISVAVGRMQRNFEPMRKQVGAWQKSELTDVTAKVVIYEAFVEGRGVFRNAFTSAFKELEPIPQFKATAKLGEFREAQFSPAVIDDAPRGRARHRQNKQNRYFTIEARSGLNSCGMGRTMLIDCLFLECGATEGNHEQRIHRRVSPVCASLSCEVNDGRRIDCR